MGTGGRLIERYILAAIVPYILLALALLTVMLFAQQSSRFAELLLVVQVQSGLATQVALALVPSVLVFTLPMATLAGILIGFSRLGGDSEFIAMRAAGVGTWRMVLPVLLTGIVITLAATWINLKAAPYSARALRQTAIRGALSKLDSPVEPGSFNTEIPHYLIYVRDGDKEQGIWGRVFIYAEDEKTGMQRIVTARSGRIDTSAEQSELVLSDAVSVELPTANSKGSYVATRLAQLRFQLETGRKDILEQLHGGIKLEEMSWHELGAYAATKSGAAARDASTQQQKRAALCVAPLLFALLGAGIGLRIKKGGRGMGMLLSISTLVAYYLLSLIGEQLSRAGTVPLLVGVWGATALTLLCSAWLLFTGRHDGLGRLVKASLTLRQPKEYGTGRTEKNCVKERFGGVRWAGFPSLLDVSLALSLGTSFAFAFVSLVAIFLIFTLFELSRSIIENSAEVGLIVRYMLFLLPLVSVQVLPASVLLAVLTAYALLSKRSESVAWWASGQSVYRLMLPGVLLSVMVAIGAWMIQERLMPKSYQRQDALRMRIKHRAPQAVTPVGRQWLASTDTTAGRLYAYEFNDEKKSLSKLAVYEFDDEAVHLKTIRQGSLATWSAPHTLLIRDGTVLKLSGGQVTEENGPTSSLSKAETREAFKPMLKNPAQLSAKELSSYIQNVHRQDDAMRTLLIALQGKYAEPFGSIVLALVGMPLALSFGRRSAIAALCLALAIGLGFWATTGGFRQMGTYGLLPVTLAAWSPVAIFASIGGYLLARSRT